VSEAYKATPLPPLGSAEHLGNLLAPASLPVVKRSEKIRRDIKQWTADSIKELQG